MKDIKIEFTNFFFKPLDKKTIRKDINFKAGVYFWFTDEQALKKLKIEKNGNLFQIVRENEPLFLIYIGIGPSNGEVKRQFLKDRITNCHLGKLINKSTFRQSISALLEHKPFNKKIGKNIKIFVESGSESDISDLIKSSFSLAIIQHSEPWTIEKGLIQTYKPPINLAGNEAGWFYDRMKEKRDKHRELGKVNLG
jgi:hypothetical protein